MLVKITSLMAAAAVAIATPAAANELPATGAIDVERVAQGGNDAEFGELFASWESLENGGRVSPAGTIVDAPQRLAVSVPSRMPVNDVTLTSSYGMRSHPVLGGRRQHNGVDLAAPTGTPVYATADGVIEMAQWYSSYGNYVQIAHGGEMETRYAHLSSYTVSAGSQVRQGDLIGYVGSTGRSTGPHLHYEVRVAGAPVDPRPYMLASIDTDNGVNAARGGPDE
ncbi:M23 family metallopeptidase [Aurantiacibacter luteus]|uniref:Membrane protein n=1 Tax=Aurantiacibacter luteus TaxID=1581420 RepID=A0A0G9MU23_9SPHN|nr:M23 family metallopeptidase [Aurantiacibacter luteus]KLE34232.1 membrane protein [Aurantiacibacter luteus]